VIVRKVDNRIAWRNENGVKLPRKGGNQAIWSTLDEYSGLPRKMWFGKPENPGPLF
jgi:hypothetical protein